VLDGLADEGGALAEAAGDVGATGTAAPDLLGAADGALDVVLGEALADADPDRLEVPAAVPRAEGLDVDPHAPSRPVSPRNPTTPANR
jgi:hypothetical protein